MVNDMLDGSRLDSGMVSVVRRNTGINDIIQRMRPMLDRKAAVKGTNLRYELTESLPQVYIDEEKIGRVLVNLAVNALKFCGDPGEITIWTRRDARGGATVGVTDNGPGIPIERQLEIFKRFNQLGTNVRESAMGFGLGLSIAKELVELNLGELSLVSKPGCGTTFQFTLPSAEPIEILDRYLDRVSGLPGRCKTVSLITASIPPEETSSAADVGEFLAHLLRCNDLMFQTHAHCWLVLTTLSPIEEDKMLERLQTSLRDANRNRPNRQFPEVVFTRIATNLTATRRQDITQQCMQKFTSTSPRDIPASYDIGTLVT